MSVRDRGKFNDSSLSTNLPLARCSMVLRGFCHLGPVGVVRWKIWSDHRVILASNMILVSPLSNWSCWYFGNGDSMEVPRKSWPELNVTCIHPHTLITEPVLEPCCGTWTRSNGPETLRARIYHPSHFASSRLVTYIHRCQRIERRRSFVDRVFNTLSSTTLQQHTCALPTKHRRHGSQQPQGPSEQSHALRPQGRVSESAEWYAAKGGGASWQLLMRCSGHELHRDGGQGARGDKQRAMGYVQPVLW
jgi:hypothetical protein